MRKWFVIVMAAIGMTLFMLLGLGDVARVEAPDPFGTTAAPETGLPDEATAPRVALRAVVSLEPGTFEGLRRATERYESIRPNVAVSLQNVAADELRGNVRTSTETGDAPDIMLYPTEWVRREAAEGRLLSLDDYVPAERQSQWFETVRGAVRWNGYLWGVPADWDPYVFVFREDDAFGSSIADAPPTASAWLEYADGGDAGALAGATAEYGAALLRHWSARLEDEAAESPANDEGPDAVAAASGEAEAAESGDAEPPEAAEGAQLDEASAEAAPIRGTAAAVAKGEAVWALAPLSQALAAQAAEPSARLTASAFVPDPEAAGGLPPFAGRSYVVSPATDHAAEAADWIRFVTDASTVEEFGTVGGERWPVTRSSFGLPSSFASGKPTVLGATGPAGALALPDANGLDARDAMNALRPLIRMIDAARASYGTPPEELPPSGDGP
ncbi:extracellular solute-binding protein [Paenibacillus antri]|uniref:Extracellular solute-binding protein n=1 Tax=Paenibacillus antri TaxID=2582848 RepID=A0A5R9G7L7_9BACL|nr:extracellular solute-binding protein [Paenibacillus antri]TLS50376.1 extracellular solute-binding protein [Paenibacillus antri]